jgi:hypothetical protein
MMSYALQYVVSDTPITVNLLPPILRPNLV